MSDIRIRLTNEIEISFEIKEFEEYFGSIRFMIETKISQMGFYMISVKRSFWISFNEIDSFIDALNRIPSNDNSIASLSELSQEFQFNVLRSGSEYAFEVSYNFHYLSTFPSGNFIFKGQIDNFYALVEQFKMFPRWW